MDIKNLQLEIKKLDAKVAQVKNMEATKANLEKDIASLHKEKSGLLVETKNLKGVIKEVVDKAIAPAVDEAEGLRDGIKTELLNLKTKTSEMNAAKIGHEDAEVSIKKSIKLNEDLANALEGQQVEIKLIKSRLSLAMNAIKDILDGTS